MELALDIEMYETLREPLTDNGAKTFVRLLDSKMDHVFESKKDVLASKHDVALLQSDITELRIATFRDYSDLRAELKQDMAGLRAELKQDMAELRADMRVEIAGTKSDLIKWMFIFLIGQAAAIIGVIKLL